MCVSLGKPPAGKKIQPAVKTPKPTRKKNEHQTYLDKKNNLFVENVSVKKLTSKFSTPFYLYSEGSIIENYKSFSNNFKKSKPLICFSVKANSNIQILKVLKKLGSGADVVSGGELLKAIKSGIKPNKIVFSGVGKTEEEIRLAINKNILLINVESENEAILINKIAGKLKKRTSIGVRLNPDINAPTHKKYLLVKQRINLVFQKLA